MEIERRMATPTGDDVHPPSGAEAITIGDYKDLVAWQKVRSLVRSIYEATRSFPAEERFGLTQQLRRAAVSVPSNIAEGYGRGSLRDYIRFLQMARGSLYEIETQLYLAQDMGYLEPGVAVSITDRCAECVRILQGLISALNAKTPREGSRTS